jgi:hypothetical protein
LLLAVGDRGLACEIAHRLTAVRLTEHLPR